MIFPLNVLRVLATVGYNIGLNEMSDLAIAVSVMDIIAREEKKGTPLNCILPSPSARDISLSFVCSKTCVNHPCEEASITIDSVASAQKRDHQIDVQRW